MEVQGVGTCVKCGRPAQSRSELAPYLWCDECLLNYGAKAVARRRKADHRRGVEPNKIDNRRAALLNSLLSETVKAALARGDGCFGSDDLPCHRRTAQRTIRKLVKAGLVERLPGFLYFPREVFVGRLQIAAAIQGTSPWFNLEIIKNKLGGVNEERLGPKTLAALVRLGVLQEHDGGEAWSVKEGTDLSRPEFVLPQ